MEHVAHSQEPTTAEREHEHAHAVEEQAAIEVRPDLDIAADVEEQIWRYEQVRQTHPPFEVIAHNGVVVLTGNVRSRIIRKVMGDIAAQVPGVIRVENQVYTDPDLELAAVVALGRSSATSELANAVRVSSTHGVVVLYGEVSSPQVRDEAIGLISNIPGVRRVLDEIMTRGQPAKA